MRQNSEWQMSFIALALVVGTFLAYITIGLSDAYMLGIILCAAATVVINIFVIMFKKKRTDKK